MKNTFYNFLIIINIQLLWAAQCVRLPRRRRRGKGKAVNKEDELTSLGSASSSSSNNSNRIESLIFDAKTHIKNRKSRQQVNQST